VKVFFSSFFSSGYLVQRYGWQSSLYLLSAIHLGIFFAHLFFGPETLDPPEQARRTSSSSSLARKGGFWDGPMSLRATLGMNSYDLSPISLREIVAPLFMICVPTVVIPVLVCAS
jgi:hypothetical protein